MNAGQLVDLKRHSGACSPVVEEQDCPTENALGSCSHNSPMPDGYAGITLYVDKKSPQSIAEQQQNAREKCKNRIWTDGSAVQGL